MDHPDEKEKKENALEIHELQRSVSLCTLCELEVKFRDQRSPSFDCSLSPEESLVERKEVSAFPNVSQMIKYRCHEKGFTDFNPVGKHNNFMKAKTPIFASEDFSNSFFEFVHGPINKKIPEKFDNEFLRNKYDADTVSMMSSNSNEIKMAPRISHTVVDGITRMASSMTLSNQEVKEVEIKCENNEIRNSNVDENGNNYQEFKSLPLANDEFSMEGQIYDTLSNREIVSKILNIIGDEDLSIEKIPEPPSDEEILRTTLKVIADEDRRREKNFKSRRNEEFFRDKFKVIADEDRREEKNFEPRRDEEIFQKNFKIISDEDRREEKISEPPGDEEIFRKNFKVIVDEERSSEKICEPCENEEINRTNFKVIAYEDSREKEMSGLSRDEEIFRDTINVIEDRRKERNVKPPGDEEVFWKNFNVIADGDRPKGTKPPGDHEMLWNDSKVIVDDYRYKEKNAKSAGEQEIFRKNFKVIANEDRREENILGPPGDEEKFKLIADEDQLKEKTPELANNSEIRRKKPKIISNELLFPEFRIPLRQLQRKKSPVHEIPCKKAKLTADSFDQKSQISNSWKEIENTFVNIKDSRRSSKHSRLSVNISRPDHVQENSVDALEENVKSSGQWKIEILSKKVEISQSVEQIKKPSEKKKKSAPSDVKIFDEKPKVTGNPRWIEPTTSFSTNGDKRKSKTPLIVRKVPAPDCKKIQAAITKRRDGLSAAVARLRKLG